MNATRERFNQLARQWKHETAFHSNPSIIMNNDAYREIVLMGQDALPFIFEKLAEDKNGLWWLLLEEITGTKLTDGVTPIPNVPGWVKTDVPTLKAAWLTWGRAQGYLAGHQPDGD